MKSTGTSTATRPVVKETRRWWSWNQRIREKREKSLTYPGYDALVAGSATLNPEWLPEASEFLSRLASTFAGSPVWLFSVGMPAALPKRIQGWGDVRRAPDGYKLATFVNPRGHHLFSGVVRKEHLTPAGRAKFRLIGGRYREDQLPITTTGCA